MTSCRTYSPYGAWELKRAYQRNLLLANMSVILAVSLAIAIPSVLGGKTVDVGPLIPDGTRSSDTLQVIDLPTTGVTIIRDGGTPTPRELAGAIPVPIADSLFSEDEDPVIASQDELALIYQAEAEEFYGRGGMGDPDAIVIAEPEAPEPTDYVLVDEPPAMVHEVKPDYPRLAKMAGIEGTVWIQALVDLDGSVREARVGKSSRTPALDEAAMAAAWKNRYTPAIRANQPVLVWVIYKVDFRLE